MLNVQALKEARASKTDAIRGIINKATSENRDLTDIEQGAFDTGMLVAAIVMAMYSLTSCSEAGRRRWAV